MPGADLAPARTRIALRELELLFGDLTPRKPDTEAMLRAYRTVRACWERDESLERVPSRTLRRVPWFLFSEHDDEEPLAEDARFVTVWLSWLGQNPRPSTLVALVMNLVAPGPEGFPPPGWPDVAARTSALLAGSTRIRLQKWRLRVKAFGLLEAPGAERVAASWMSREFGYFGSELGHSWVVRSGHTQRALRGWLCLVEETLTQDAGEALSLLHRVKDLWENLESRGAPTRLGEQWSLPGALTRPFLERPAALEYRMAVYKFLVDQLGDPEEPGKWGQVDPDVTRTLVEWGIGVRVEIFFKVIDRTVRTETDWRYRRQFWLAALKAGAVVRVWPVFGPAARRLLKEGTAFTVVPQHGRLDLDRGAATSDHSVLLFQLPDETIVAEWSHEVGCGVWYPDSMREQGYGRHMHRPDLGEASYRAGQLKSSFSKTVLHRWSEEGRWQRTLARVIRERTQIQLDEEHYLWRP